MKAGWVNLLEDGTTTVTSAAAGHPAYYLYDRLFGRMWQAANVATQTVQVDQGASPVSFDALIVPTGHLLSGCGMTFEGSDNGSSWSPLVTGWTEPSGGGWIQKQAAAPLSHRFVRSVISGASVAPEAGEIFVTRLVEFIAPLYGARSTREAKASRTQGLEGQPHYVVNGVSARVYSYSGDAQDATEKAFYRAWFAHWAEYRRPFFVEDHLGDPGFYEFVDEPEIVEGETFLATFTLRQVF